MSSYWSRPRPVLTCDWLRSVTVGADADLVIWDAKQSKTISSEEHLSKCDVNIFQDLACTGGPEFVIFKGRMVLGTCKYFSQSIQIFLYVQIFLANYSNIFIRQIFFRPGHVPADDRVRGVPPAAALLAAPLRQAE